MNGIGIFFLILFCATLFASYLIIRRGLMRASVTAGLCATLTVTCVIAFALSEDRTLLHALVAGMVVGVSFTFVMVAMAVFFARNQPDDLEAYLKQDQR